MSEQKIDSEQVEEAKSIAIEKLIQLNDEFGYYSYNSDQQRKLEALVEGAVEMGAGIANDTSKKQASRFSVEALVMPCWGKQAHLFANGIFKVSIEPYTKIENDFWDFVGFYCGELMLEKGDNDDFEHEQINPVECVLVARPMSDMSDEEMNKWKSFIYEKKDRMIPVYAKQTAYLLSIGVYPFDQTAFESGDVIDASKV